jgi:HD superfamily phosphohydrolase
VAEGTVGSDRIIKMMEVVNGELVLEEKGIYSIEKFLLARRLMYWQVYLHKTVLSAENLLVNMLKRAKYLVQNGEVVFATKGLNYFLNSINSTYNENLDEEFIEHFSHLDDYDIFAAAKEWMSHSDRILSDLSSRLIERKLFKIRIDDQPFKQNEIESLKVQWQLKGNSEQDISYYIFTGEITNSAYKSGEEKINILLKNGTIRDVRDASDQLRLSVYSESIRKYFLCYPKEIDTIN